MNYINGRLTGVASANDLEAEIQELKNTKQNTLVSGQSIKTINSQTLLGSGNLEINVGTWGAITGTLSDQTDLQTALNSKQGNLTAGTNITINSNNVISSTCPVSAVDNGDYITLTIGETSYNLTKYQQ